MKKTINRLKEIHAEHIALFNKYDYLKAEHEHLEMFIKTLGYTSEDLDNIVIGNFQDLSKGQKVY